MCADSLVAHLPRMVAPLRLVAPVLFNTAQMPPFGRAHLGGRAPPQNGRAPLQALKLQKLATKSLACFLARIFDFHLHNKSELRGKLAFIGSL